MGYPELNWVDFAARVSIPTGSPMVEFLGSLNHPKRSVPGEEMMKSLVAACLLVASLGTGTAFAAAVSGHGPSASWNEMQKFEYYIGDVAGALNLCRMYGKYAEMSQLAALTPYGKIGMKSRGPYDGIRGGSCGRISSAAEKILGDKEKLLDYLKAKYDCSSGKCVER